MLLLGLQATVLPLPYSHGLGTRLPLARHLHGIQLQHLLLHISSFLHFYSFKFVLSDVTVSFAPGGVNESVVSTLHARSDASFNVLGYFWQTDKATAGLNSENGLGLYPLPCHIMKFRKCKVSWLSQAISKACLSFSLIKLTALRSLWKLGSKHSPRDDTAADYLGFVAIHALWAFPVIWTWRRHVLLAQPLILATQLKCSTIYPFVPLSFAIVHIRYYWQCYFYTVVNIYSKTAWL